MTPVYGITVTDIGGARIFTANTKWDQIKTKDLKKGQQVKVEWTIPNVFNTGDFIISPAVADEDGSIIYDWVEGMGKFKVRKKISNLSYINADHSLTIKDDNG